MDFDFFSLYKTYSNIDLLKIVNCPSEYQPQAVLVAHQILKEREVTEEQTLMVHEYFEGLNRKKVLRKERVDHVTALATELI